MPEPSPEQFRDAYDKTTGQKLAYPVPVQWFDIFSNLRKTPVQKSRENVQVTEPARQAAPAANQKEK